MNWLEVFAKAGAIQRLMENKKEIYRLSRLLPEEEGLRLVELYEETITTKDWLHKQQIAEKETIR